MAKSKSTELIVALDVDSAERAEAILGQLDGLPVLYKVGIELFLAVGPVWVKTQTQRGRRIFLDLKFYDIPNTVARGALQAVEMGVEMFTLHLAGGPKMIEATRFELDKLGTKIPKILGVSVLTSFDQNTWDEVCYALTELKAPIEGSVRRLVAQSRYWGVDGVVCSAHELKVVSKIDPILYTVVPGIRPEGTKSADQARVMTPKKACSLGAKAVVVGRPILEAKNPREICESILKDLRTTPHPQAMTKKS